MQTVAAPDTTSGIPIAYAPITVWLQISGMRRTSVYDAIGRGDLHAIKIGPKKLLIDVPRGLAWLRSMPAARIAAPKKTRQAA